MAPTSSRLKTSQTAAAHADMARYTHGALLGHVEPSLPEGSVPEIIVKSHGRLAPRWLGRRYATITEGLRQALNVQEDSD